MPGRRPVVLLADPGTPTVTLSAAHVEVLARVRAGAPGALLALSPRAGWLHIELVWPGGDRARVAVHPRTHRLFPVGADDRVDGTAIPPERPLRLRREPQPRSMRRARRRPACM